MLIETENEKKEATTKTARNERQAWKYTCVRCPKKIDINEQEEGKNNSKTLNNKRRQQENEYPSKSDAQIILLLQIPRQLLQEKVGCFGRETQEVFQE